MIANRKQIRDAVLNATNQDNNQIGSFVNDFINVTIQEIGSPGWAFPKERYHLWSWLKRKTSFVASSEDTILERDVDKIALLRQTSSPTKIWYMTDEQFYKELPNPTETGNPRIYRLWEVTGVSTKLSTARTLKVVSSSNLDDSSYSCMVTGYMSGRLETEAFVMNGTTNVSGSKTFDARELFISKSGLFNGNLIIKDSADNTLVTIGKEEITPRFKVVSLWPTPTSITVYMEYYKKIKELNADDEAPEFDPKFHHVVRLGTLAKTYQLLGKTNDFVATQELYAKMVRSWVQDDSTHPDSIDYIKKRDIHARAGVRLHLSEDVII